MRGKVLRVIVTDYGYGKHSPLCGGLGVRLGCTNIARVRRAVEKIFPGAPLDNGRCDRRESRVCGN